VARDGLTLSILLLSSALVSACNSAPKPSEARQTEPATAPAPAAAAETPQDPPAPAEPAAAPEGPASGEIPMAPPPPIPPAPTPEELKMLELDPKDLTPDERRKRARIRYRQIMQNPDSPQARVIRQAQAQMFNQVPPKDGDSGQKSNGDQGLILHAPHDRYPTPEERAAKAAPAQDG
jgi:hypothetical protein